nr:hypothetical protein [Tanacetum cinerariifolium]
MTTPPPSPLTSLSLPSVGERLARCTTPAALPSPPLPPSSYPPPVDRRYGIPEFEQPPHKRLGLATLGSREVGYGIRDTWIKMAEEIPEMAPTTLEKVNTRVTELAELHEHDTQDLYALLEDTRDGADEELSNEGSPRVIVYGYDGLPMLPVAPPSPDYMPGLEEPQTPPAPQDEDEHELVFIQPHDLDFVPEPIYPEYIPLEDEHILPAEEQLLPPVVSPTTESLGYVAESDLEEDLEEYKEDETEDGPVGYPMDGGNDGDDDDGDSSGYDADNEDEDEEGEEHLAPAVSTVVIPTNELASPPEGTEPVIPPPSTDTAITGASITIQPQTSISLPLEVKVERLLAMPTPSPSPLTSLSPPSTGERLARCTAPAALPSPLLPPSLYPPPVDRRDNILKSEQPPRKRISLSTLSSGYEVGESSTRDRGVDYGFANTVEAEMRHQGIREVGYGIRDAWIDLAEVVPKMAPTTFEGVNTRVTELAELHEHDTHDLYALLEDAQDVWIVEEEAYAAREAWAYSVGLSQTVHHELQTLREQQQLHETHSQIQQTDMAGLQETDRVRQSQIVETLQVIRDMRREMGDMQAELLALRGQPRRAGQPGGDVRVPNHQDAPRDADSHI